MSDAETAGRWIRQASARLAAADPNLRAPAEARALLAKALQVPAERLFAYPETPTPAAAARRADALLDRRLGGEPLSRILGRKEFWSLEFEISPDVLDPRADTETLVETALALAGDGPPERLLDLGVGSGCILLSLLSEWPSTTGVGVDRSAAAAKVARQNADRLGLDDRAQMVVGDWTMALAEGAFDMIVANPPYVATAAGPTPDAATVGFDPAAALWAGPDGLAAYRSILADVGRTAQPGALLLLEVGAGQADAVDQLATARGFETIRQARDLAGHVRCLAFSAPA